MAKSVKDSSAVATVEAPKAEKVKKAKATKVETKKPEKKAEVKTEPKAKATAKPVKVEVKDGLRTAQIKILEMIAGEPKGISKKGLIEKGIEATSLGGYIGLKDLEQRKALQARNGRVCLLDQGVIEEKVSEGEEGREVILFKITSAGKEALKEYVKAQKEAQKEEAKAKKD